MTPFFTIVNKYQTSFALYEMCMILRSFSIISPVKSITDKSQLQTNHFLNKPMRKKHAREIFEITNRQIVIVLFISCSVARVRKKMENKNEVLGVLIIFVMEGCPFNVKLHDCTISSQI